MWDTEILIIGAGPAGIQAAIHAARRKAKVVVLGKTAKSSLGWAWVENLFCVLGEVSGKELLRKGKEQARKFGATFVEADAVRLGKVDGDFLCELEGGQTVKSKALILSTGIARNKSPIRGEEEFIGKGVSYCADCDGPLFKGKRVAVIGGESAAYVAAESLMEYASDVFLVDPEGAMSTERRGTLSAKGVKLQDKVPTGVEGKSTVQRLTFGDGTFLELDGIFIEMGSRGIMELALPIGIIPNEKGFIDVDRSQRTEVEGVFACGDITGPPFQVCKAIGEGCVAGLSAIEHVRDMSKRGPGLGR